jgi:peroxiredoxin
MLATMQTKRDFTLNNHENISYRLSMMMGEKGILLAFTGDVWDLSCVRYALWMQRQCFKLASAGLNAALIIPNHTYELNGFFMSIPRGINAPLLADPKYQVYGDFDMALQGFVLLNREGDILNKWYITDTASLSARAVLACLEEKQR